MTDLGTGTTGGGSKSKKYFLAKSESADELIVGKKKHVFKDEGTNDPVDLTEDEAKAARAKGIQLTEAKP